MLPEPTIATDFFFDPMILPLLEGQSDRAQASEVGHELIAWASVDGPSARTRQHDVTGPQLAPQFLAAAMATLGGFARRRIVGYVVAARGYERVEQPLLGQPFRLGTDHHGLFAPTAGGRSSPRGPRTE